MEKEYITNRLTKIHNKPSNNSAIVGFFSDGVNFVPSGKTINRKGEVWLRINENGWILWETIPLEAMPDRKPRWITYDDGTGEWVCPKCGYPLITNPDTGHKYHYCRNCKLEFSQEKLTDEEKKMVQIGDYIIIDNIDDEPRYTGKGGYVRMIDDAGQIHGSWGNCALIPGTDSFHIKTAKRNEPTKEIDW